MTRLHNWRRSPIDLRDKPFESLGLALKPTTDFEPRLPSIWDQGQRSSCTAHALAAAHADLHPGFDPSRDFIWWNERNMEGTANSDTGCYGRDGVKSLHKLGVCPESMLPYDVHHFKGKPSPECFAAALPHRIGSYHALHSLDDMLQCLNSGYGFVAGFTVYESFEGEEVAKTGVLNMPQHGEKDLGGHEVYFCGYDLAARRFKVRNSYGKHWGQAGYFTMPFEYAASTKLTDDRWTLRA